MPLLSNEVLFRTARSGGKGGQNVNKVETAAEAWWHPATSGLYSEEDKAIIAEKLRNRINKEGFLLVKASETRSQLENKAIALEKLEALVAQSLVRPKKRKASKPGKAAIERRLDGKRKNAEKKASRRGED